MYGIQTQTWVVQVLEAFENDVNMYGIQTGLRGYSGNFPFENDVNMYGIQTQLLSNIFSYSLRMM